MISLIRKSFSFFENLVYPLKCLKCGAYIDPGTARADFHTCFCRNCLLSGFWEFDSPFCSVCGLKFRGDFNEDHLCEDCLRRPGKIHKVRAALEYRGITKDAVRLFKYSSKLYVAKVFEALMFKAFQKYFLESHIDFILPIPLHKTRLNQRGFNQAYLIIRNFEKKYRKIYRKPPSWKIDVFLLARVKETRPQTGFDIRQRKDNLKDAFRVLRKGQLRNRNILLVDDVYTTGSTCKEAASVVLEEGAGTVSVLVLARA